MNASDSTLHRRYRRLLASYPRPFRDERGEELLAVLLDCARDGQRYPRPREAADLVVHGLLARVRSRQRETDLSPAQDRVVSWGDALATSSVHGFGPAPVGSWTLPRWLKWLAVLPAVVAIAVPTRIAISDLFVDHAVHALAGYSGSGSATGAIGQTSYHGLLLRPAGNNAASTTLNLRSVEPRLTVNTAHATVTILICTGPGAGPLIYGGTSQSAAEDCTRLSVFRSGTIRVGTSMDTQTTTGVLVAVTPHHSGVVRIEGANVTYRQASRYGHQHVGMDWTLHVP